MSNIETEADALTRRRMVILWTNFAIARFIKMILNG